jgi:hypothetical protein
MVHLPIDAWRWTSGTARAPFLGSRNAEGRMPIPYPAAASSMTALGALLSMRTLGLMLAV